jgi:outer membrane protein assembly factor BamE (lipoprotein component of BamABCDE complex)
MQRHLRYSLMTLTLGSVLLYTFHMARKHHTVTPTTQGLSETIHDQEQVESATVAPEAKSRNPFAVTPTTPDGQPDAPSMSDETAAKSRDSVRIGSTRQEVFASLGAPKSTNAANDQWYYDGRVVLFSGERVIGTIKPDLAQAKRAAATNLNAVFGEDAAPVKTTPRATAPRKATSQYNSSRSAPGKTSRNAALESAAARAIGTGLFGSDGSYNARMYPYRSAAGRSSFDRAKSKTFAMLRNSTPFGFGPSATRVALFEPLSSVSRKHFGYNSNRQIVRYSN